MPPQHSTSLPATANYQLVTLDAPRLVVIESGVPARTLVGPGKPLALDYYAFHLNADATVDITRHSTAFDPYLILFSEDGTELAANDDYSTDTLDSELIRQLGAGTYIIGVNSVGLGEPGAYTLVTH